MHDNDLAVFVEMKAVNNRYFKLSLRLSEGFANLEWRVEPFLRKTIDRGTLNVTIRVRHEGTNGHFRINESVLLDYFSQAAQAAKIAGCAEPNIAHFLTLPGVLNTEGEPERDDEFQWITVEQALSEALRQLQEMRKREGALMANDLDANLEGLETLIDEVAKQAPTVASAYRQKLTERMAKILENQNHPVSESDLLREVALFADRCDISEEIVRFRSHLAQFRTAMNSSESCGRKLDFLTQELFRETNTIGSKANDTEIIKRVVDMKALIERMREMVQNIE